MKRLNVEITTQLGSSAIVSVQDSIRSHDFLEPQPDIAVLKPRPEFYDRSLPTAAEVLLVVEVSDAILAFDREIKLPTFARAGIPEAWLADIPAETEEKHSEPVNGVYRKVESFRRGEAIASSSVIGLTIEVVKILGE